MHGVGTTRERLLLDILHGFGATVFSLHNTQLLFICFRELYFYEIVIAFPLSQWSEKLQGKIYTMKVNTLPPEGCEKCFVILKRLLTRH